MVSATKPWIGTIIRPARRLRTSRHRPVDRWLTLNRVLVKLVMGLMLVGCSSVPGLRLGERRQQVLAQQEAVAPRGTGNDKILGLFPRLGRGQEDPVAALQAGAMGDDRLEAYQQLALVDRLAPSERAMARQLLIQGSTKEYSVLTRSAAVSSLASYMEPDATEALLQAASDRSPIVRMEAAHALSGRPEQMVRQRLQAMATGDTDADVRLSATESLISISDAGVLSTLVDCLQDQEFAVAHRASEGLKQLTNQAIDSDRFEDWKAWVDANGTFQPIQNTAQQTDSGSAFRFFRR